MDVRNQNSNLQKNGKKRMKKAMFRANEADSKRLFIALAMFVLLLCVGTIGYMWIEHVPFLKSLYMTVITISTVGFQEVVSLSDVGQIFTIFIIFWALAVVGYTFSTVIVMFVDGRMKEIWRGRTMQHKLKSMKNHYIICGYGEVCDVIAEELAKMNVPFVIVTRNQEAVEEYLANDYIAFCSPPTNEDTLIQVGVERARGLLSVQPNDADNIVTVLTARELVPNLRIVSLANEHESVDKLLRVGANNTLSTSQIGGKRLVALLTKPNVISYLDVITQVGDYELDLEEICIRQPSALIGEELKNAQLPKLFGVMILAIRRENETQLMFNPGSDTILQAGDHLIVIGPESQMNGLRKMANDRI